MIEDKLKKWMVTGSLCGIEKSFETEDEAKEYALEILSDHRDEAVHNEWDAEVGNLRVYELKYKASIVKEWKDEEAEKKIEKLRAALAGFIGAETPEELDAMEVVLRTTPAPESDKILAINAIDALRTCA